MGRQVLFLALLALPLGFAPQGLAQQAGKGTSLPVFATKAEAEKAAKTYNCTGAHPMGDKWMPCAHHGNAQHN